VYAVTKRCQTKNRGKTNSNTTTNGGGREMNYKVKNPWTGTRKTKKGHNRGRVYTKIKSQRAKI